MSQALVRLQRKGQMVLPRALREEAGVTEGALMKVAVIEGGQFLLTPQLTIDRSIVTAPSRSRKQVLKELAQAVDELRKDAREKGLHTMSMAEINRAVAKARNDLKKGIRKRSAK